MTLYDSVSNEKIGPPAGYRPRFDNTNVYSGGGASQYFMDPTTYNLYWNEQKQRKPKPERRINFIERNRERIAELSRSVGTIENKEDEAEATEMMLDEIPCPLEPENNDFTEEDVDRLLKFTENIHLGDESNNEEQPSEGRDEFQEQLIQELKDVERKVEEKQLEQAQEKNEYKEKQEILNATDLPQEESTLVPVKRHPFNIVEFTNSMTNTRNLLEAQEPTFLDDIEDLSKEIIKRVKERQHADKCGAPFLQPFVFRGRF